MRKGKSRSPLVIHKNCEVEIEYLPTSAKGCQYPMRCKKHRKKGKGRWIKWATALEYEAYMSLQNTKSSDAI